MVRPICVVKLGDLKFLLNTQLHTIKMARIVHQLFKCQGCIYRSLMLDLHKTGHIQ